MADLLETANIHLFNFVIIDKIEHLNYSIFMGRLSIEISKQQHQQIKAVAALRGMSMKDYILQAALSSLPKAQSQETEIEYISALGADDKK